MSVSVLPGHIDIAVRIQGQPCIARGAEAVGNLWWRRREVGAPVTRASKEDVRISVRGFPNHVDVADKIHRDLRNARVTKENSILREILRGREVLAVIVRAAEEDVRIKVNGGSTLPNHVDGAAKIHGNPGTVGAANTAAIGVRGIIWHQDREEGRTPIDRAPKRNV